MSDHAPSGDASLAARDTFIGLISHAFGGALQPLIGSLALLDDEAYGPLTDDQRRLVAQASASVEQLRQFQEDIVLLTRAQSQTLRLRRQPIPLTTLLREAIAEAQQPHPPETARVIASHVSPALPPLPCDADLLRRALAALIENALRFSPADAPVSIAARKRSAWVIIRVRDGGAGLTPDEAQRLAAPLVVGAAPLQHVGVGLGVGLGLAVAQVSAEAHGGRLTVEPPSSQAPGATFTLELPLSPEQSQQA